LFCGLLVPDAELRSLERLDGMGIFPEWGQYLEFARLSCNSYCNVFVLLGQIGGALERNVSMSMLAQLAVQSCILVLHWRVKAALKMPDCA
jgi:hypothetical protein